MSDARNNRIGKLPYNKFPVTFNTNDQKINIELKQAQGTLLQEESYKYEQEKTKNTFSVWKNIIVLSIALMLLFTAFTSLQNLQSTLNSEKGIGTLSLSIIYASFILSYFFLTSFIICHLGYKYTLCVSVLSYCVFIAGNFRFKWYYITLPISALIMGLGSAPLWVAQGLYIRALGKQFLANDRHHSVIPKLFGGVGHIWGNLISSYVLGLERNDRNITENSLHSCGKNLCPFSEIQHFTYANVYMPSDHWIDVLCGVYVTLALLACLLILLLDNVKELKTKRKMSLDLFIQTIHHLKDPRQILLILMSLYVGLQMAFIASDFTAAFVSCNWGIDKIGYVMMSYGLLHCMSSVIFGVLTKVIGRIPLFLVTIFINVSLLSIMLTWTPSSQKHYIFFVISSFWGIGDCIWQDQCLALYGSLFHKTREAGFANKCLWESIGFSIAFGYSSYLCTAVKIYILLAFINTSAILYFFVEYIDWQKRKAELL